MIKLIRDYAGEVNDVLRDWFSNPMFWIIALNGMSVVLLLELFVTLLKSR